MNDPRPTGWRGDNSQVIQGSVQDVNIHSVYVDTGSSADIIYEHYFRLLPEKCKEALKPVPGQFTSFTVHSIWPLGQFVTEGVFFMEVSGAFL